MELIDNIYIERGPFIKGIDSITSQRLRESLEKILALKTDENKEEVRIAIEELLKDKDVNYSLYYDGTTSLWLREDIEGIIYLRSSGYDTHPKTFKNEAELNDRFMKLTDFIDSSQYIGKRFNRTKSLLRGSVLHNDYENGLFCPIVLYSNGAYMLVVDDEILEIGDVPVYYMMSPDYISDLNYELGSKVDDSYRNKETLYNAICEQVRHDFKYDYMKKNKR